MIFRNALIGASAMALNATTSVFPLLLFCAVTIATASSALADDDAEKWHFRLTPYLWLPTIEGMSHYELPPGGGGSPGVSVGPSDWLDLLNFGALVGGSAQKGRFSIFADLVYLSMTSKDDRIIAVEDTITNPGTGISVPVSADLNLNTRTDLEGLLWSLTAGYALSQREDARLDVFAGVRYFKTDISARWDLAAEISVPGAGVILPAQGRIGANTTLWDGIVGIRGAFDVGEGNWSVPYSFDIGKGDSDQTWNAMAGLARKFGWGDLLIAYRHLEYDQGAGSLLQDFTFSGPAIGARFNF